MPGPSVRPFFLVAVVSVCVLSCRDGGSDTPVFPGALREERRQFRERLVRETIEATLAGGVYDSTEQAWEQAFWAMGLIRYESSIANAGYLRALATCQRRSVAFQRALLEAVYGLAPGRYTGDVLSIAQETREPRLFAMAVLHVVRSEPERAAELRRLAVARFGDPVLHPILRRLDAALAPQDSGLAASRPSPARLLSARFGGRYPVVFSLQRRDRRYPGLVVVRDADGEFVREDDGSFFSVPQLALSSSGLPGYLTNGNTPEGVLSFQGFGSSDNVFIGPTPTILLVLPWEVSPGVFFHEPPTDTAWTRDLYASLLPEAWRNDTGLFEAFDAGEAGRTGIIAHGTTIDPSFTEGEQYWPNTPSLGSLTAAEVWSEETGERVWSDQQRLVEAVRKTGSDRGYCVVLVLDDMSQAVTPEEIGELLRSAEAAQQDRSAGARRQ